MSKPDFKDARQCTGFSRTEGACIFMLHWGEEGKSCQYLNCRFGSKSFKQGQGPKNPMSVPKLHLNHPERHNLNKSVWCPFYS